MIEIRLDEMLAAHEAERFVAPCPETDAAFRDRIMPLWNGESEAFRPGDLLTASGARLDEIGARYSLVRHG